jgi:hypothetical protein
MKKKGKFFLNSTKLESFISFWDSVSLERVSPEFSHQSKIKWLSIFFFCPKKAQRQGLKICPREMAALKPIWFLIIEWVLIINCESAGLYETAISEYVTSYKYF